VERPSIELELIMTEADREIVALLTDIQAAGGGGGGGSSPAGSVGDIQTKASSTTFGHITPGTGVATALAVNVGSAGAPVVLNGAGGTPSSLTLTNATGLPVAGITASTSTALGVGSINLGHASDTTITRSGSGAIQVEGVQVILSGAALGTPASGTLTNCTGLPVAGITASTSTALGVGSIELGAASDTTITRSGAGAIQVEGVQVILSGAALGTPASGVATNLTGTADGLTAGDVTRNHAIYAASSPPTVDVGIFGIKVTGVDLKNANTTSTLFTVPTSRTYIAMEAEAIITAVTGAGAGTQAFNVQNATGSVSMTSPTAGSSQTPAVGKVFKSDTTTGNAAYGSGAAGDVIRVNVPVSNAGSTTVTGTVIAWGYYSS
jgi:predicted RNA-binding protein with TRAM domain